MTNISGTNFEEKEDFVMYDIIILGVANLLPN